MYTTYFGLREEPFNLAPDPRFFYANAGHEEAYGGLLDGIHRRKGYLSLIGETGTGKTTLLRRVVEDLEPNIRTSFFYYNTTLTFDELLDFICSDFDLPVKQGRRLEKIRALDNFLRERQLGGGTGVVIIDEAHHLADEVLENLRLLSNIELNNLKLLQIILVGQPELEERLDQPELRQLKQRIAIPCRLGCLKAQDVGPFIQHRLVIAGYERHDLFTPEAVELVAQHSGGIPRIINTICDNSLSVAYRTSQQTVSDTIVEKAVQQLRLKQIRPSGQPQRKKRIWTNLRGLLEARSWNRPRRLVWTGLGIAAGFIFMMSVIPRTTGVLEATDAGAPASQTSSPLLQQNNSEGVMQERIPDSPARLPAPALAQPTLAQPTTSTATEPPITPAPSEAASLASLPQPTVPSVAKEESQPLLAASNGDMIPLQPTPSPENGEKGHSIIAMRGDTVSDFVFKVYGNYSALAFDLIKEFNPEIEDLDRITVGQHIWLPSLTRETLVRKQPDGSYHLIVGAFYSRAAATKMAQTARDEGYIAQVTQQRITRARTLYRVALEQLPDLAAADQAWSLVTRSKS